MPNLDDILDSEEEIPTLTHTKRSWKRLFVGIASYVILTILILVLSDSIENTVYISVAAVLFGAIGLIASMLGLVSAIESIWRKEDTFWRKYAAAFFSLFFVIIMALITYANLIDLYVRIF